MLTMVVTMECTMLNSHEKAFGNLNENMFHPEDSFQLEMYEFWNETPAVFLSEEKRELCSAWSPSDSCCCVGQYDQYDADYGLNRANDYASCIMGYHKTLSPLLKDSFLTTPFLRPRKTSVSIPVDGEKDDDTKCRVNLLEEMASDLTTFCVDPNEIFYNGRLSKLGSAACESRNASVGASIVSDLSSANYSDCLDYDDVWSDSDSDELPSSSSQPSEEEVDEIDVVSVSRSKNAVSDSPSLQFSSYESCILPATPLMSERVAALHNYSTRPSPCYRAAAHRVSSAPHSPSDRVVPVIAKRSVSTPSSPVGRPNDRRKRRGGAGAAERQKGRSKRFKSDVDHNKRALHNKLEQTRRLMLMGQFHQLRDVIPAIKDNSRASKSDILNNGRLYIQKLQQIELDLDIVLKKELKVKEKLERTVEATRLSCRRSSAK